MVWISFGSLCDSVLPGLDICFLLQVTELFSHNFIKLSFWDAYNARYCLRRPLMYPHLFFFSFCCYHWMISYSKSLAHSSLSPHLLLIHSRVIFHFGYLIFKSKWFFFILSSSLLKFSLCFSILFPTSVRIFINIALNPISVSSL